LRHDARARWPDLSPAQAVSADLLSFGLKNSLLTGKETLIPAHVSC
jgi:hypothetical protein